MSLLQRNIVKADSSVRNGYYLIGSRMGMFLYHAA
jgi:hypothetical protein